MFSFGKTSNKKIALPTEVIGQTYSYSREQFETANSGTKATMLQFFSGDAKVCFDCPFAVSNGAKLTACYTHKLMQYSGFISQLKSIGKQFGEWNNIPQISSDVAEKIVEMSKGKYIRFGTYGEPSLIPLELVKRICDVAKSWTGYTHQWRKKPMYADYFMASVHNAMGEDLARQSGFRSFIATPQPLNQYVNCPASNESNFASNCSKCGLCSGNKGKGKKSVYIIQH